MKSFLIITLVLVSYFAHAQNKERDWRLYNPNPNTEEIDSVKTDTINKVNPSSFIKADSLTVNPTENLEFNKVGIVTENKDLRIDEIITFQGTPETTKPVQINGYRVQVFFGQDRNEVMAKKGSFMGLYRKTKAYIIWDAPNHFLRVGNFRTQLEAQRFENEIKEHFPETTVIKSKIDLPALD